MSTYVLMRILESAPSRYDAGIRILTLGALDSAYDRLTSHIEADQKVIDFGCGTGALSLRAARKGALVTAIDINPHMLEIAQRRAVQEHLTGSVKFREMGVAELGTEASGTYDVAMSGLTFSELSEDELRFTLAQTSRLLKAQGQLLVADEVRPTRVWARTVNQLIRLPLTLLTYLLTQTSTRPVDGIEARIGEAGLEVQSIRRNGLGNFVELCARKPDGEAV